MEQKKTLDFHDMVANISHKWQNMSILYDKTVDVTCEDLHVFFCNRDCGTSPFLDKQTASRSPSKVTPIGSVVLYFLSNIRQHSGVKA